MPVTQGLLNYCTSSTDKKSLLLSSPQITANLYELQFFLFSMLIIS